MARIRSYDPAEDTAILLGVGAAHAVADPDPEPNAAGSIWLPFEGSHGSRLGGWREHRVSAPATVRARQPIGFRPR